MPLYDASPEWLKKHGLKARDARRLFGALCVFVDYEGKIKEALVAMGRNPGLHHDACDALRHLVDGDR
jgi:hypothetical protein